MPEKLEYMAKRKRKEKKQLSQSGITARVNEKLRLRKMAPSDLKYLPACEVKDILSDKQKGYTQGSKTARTSPDQYNEIGVRVKSKVYDRLKSTVAPDIKFEGTHMAEFTRRTMKNHNRLITDYKTDQLSKKIA